VHIFLLYTVFYVYVALAYS